MKTINKSLLFSGSLLALSALIVGGLSFASAHGENSKDASFRHNPEERLEMKAELFGISTDELQAMLDEGKNFRNITQELEITKEDIQAKMEEYRTNHLNQLVADGAITQEEAQERLENMGNHKKSFGGYHKGFNKGSHRMFNSQN